MKLRFFFKVDLVWVCTRFDADAFQKGTRSWPQGPGGGRELVGPGSPRRCESFFTFTDDDNNILNLEECGWKTN